MNGAVSSKNNRSKDEYDFICKHLGEKLSGLSLRDGLHRMPVSLAFLPFPSPPFTPPQPGEGILTQAALDYYETLRMAQIYNETIKDRASLNMDLDFISANFEVATWQLLSFLRDFIPSEAMRRKIHSELQFYDLEASPLYRLSMENPVINHVNTPHIRRRLLSSFPKDMKLLLSESQDFRKAYHQIFELMHHHYRGVIL